MIALRVGLKVADRIKILRLATVVIYGLDLRQLEAAELLVAVDFFIQDIEQVLRNGPALCITLYLCLAHIFLVCLALAAGPVHNLPHVLLGRNAYLSLLVGISLQALLLQSTDFAGRDGVL